MSGQFPYTVWKAAEADGAPFLTCTMFTDSHRALAERLGESLQRFGLPFLLCEVPSVHRSISIRGGDDLAYCKPRFIRAAIEHHDRPILFVDADCVVRQPPELIARLCAEGYDFAIYNWVSDPINDAWVPFKGVPGGTAGDPRRYWVFHHSVELSSETQMLSSGAVHLWRNSPATLALLEAWEASLSVHPRSIDDQCLDYAFNVATRSSRTVKYCWLPKEYMRYAWWIYAAPIIDHPDIPHELDPDSFHDMKAERLVQAEIVEEHKKRVFPRDCIVDVQDKMLLRPSVAGWQRVRRITAPLFVGE